VITALLSHNVTVGIGVTESWEARNTRFDVAWTLINADDKISREDAVALASSNLQSIFGIEPDDVHDDLVAYKGGDMLETSSKVVAVMSERMRTVTIF